MLVQERRDKDGAAIVFFESGLTDAGNDHRSIIQTLFLVLGEASKRLGGMKALLNLTLFVYTLVSKHNGMVWLC